METQIPDAGPALPPPRSAIVLRGGELEARRPFNELSISDMVAKGLIRQIGEGKGTYYDLP